MKRKLKNKSITRLTIRSLMDTLNEMLLFYNNIFPEEEQFNAIKKSEDLYKLRQTIRTSSSKNKTTKSVSSLNSITEKPESMPTHIIQALSMAATNTWRIKKKLEKESKTIENIELRRLDRHVEAIYDAFRQIGLEIFDPHGRSYDPGMALKVVTFEPTPDIQKDVIIETVKPTISWKDTIIQIGEIIVGTPQDMK
jgi:hypothetical protein